MSISFLLTAVALACSGDVDPPGQQARARPRLTVAKDTTYFTAPLRADGSVDYVAALNAHGGDT
jgi:hypothetical protein